MNQQFFDSQHRALIEVDITFHREALKELLFSRDGLVIRSIRMLLLFFILIGCVCLELTLPRYYPELCLHPLPMLIGFVTARIGYRRGIIVALAGGVLMGSGLYAPLASQCLVMVLVALSVSYGIYRWNWLDNSATINFIAVFIFSSLQLFFVSTLPWTQRLSLIPMQILFSALFAGIAAGPTFYLLLNYFAPAKHAAIPEIAPESSTTIYSSPQ